MIFTSYKEATVDYDGTEIKEWNTEFDCPFIPSVHDSEKSVCWVLYRGLFGKWKIRESYITAVKFTSCWLICIDNGWEYFANRIGKEIFKHDELEKVIRICEEKNRLRRVKIKRLR